MSERCERGGMDIMGNMPLLECEEAAVVIDTEDGLELGEVGEE